MSESTLPPPFLVQIDIETTLGANYCFPDMTRQGIEQVFSEDWVLPDGTLTLVNVSGAVLVIPTRIISTVYVNGEKKWTRS